MKKIILLLFLISIPFAQALESGKAYIVSSININSTGNIESGQSYSLVPQIVVATGSENYAGSVTPFTGCYDGKRYENGAEEGNCLIGAVNSLNSDSTTDALSAAQGKVLNDRISELASDVNSLKIGDAGGKNYFDPVRDNVSGVIVEDRNTNKIRIRGQGSPRRVSELIPAGTYYISGTFTGAWQIGFSPIKADTYSYNDLSNNVYGMGNFITNIIELIEPSYCYVSANCHYTEYITIENIQIAKDPSMEYEPYIKSLKELTESALNVDLLWTNANPTSLFAYQTVNLNLSEYKIIAIEFQYSIYETETRDLQFSTIGNGGIYNKGVFDGSVFYQTMRRYLISEDGIEFGDAIYYDGRTENFRSIPIRIFGIK